MRLLLAPTARLVLAVWIIIAGVWLAGALRTVLLLLLAALILATGLARATEWLERTGMPRGLSTGLVAASLLALLIATMAAIIVPLLDDVDRFVLEIPAVQEAIVAMLEELRRYLPFLPPIDGTFAGSPADLASRIGIRAEPGTILGVLSRFFGAIISLIFVVVMALYIAVDRVAIREFLLSFVPADRRRRAELLLDQLGLHVGGWLIGQGAICAIVGAGTFAGLIVIGVRFPLLLAAIAALGELVPLVGPFTAAALATLVAATQSPAHALLTLGFYAVFQHIDSYVLAPRIMGAAVKVHPLAVLLAIAAGAEAFGPLGALLAPPVAAVVTVLLKEIRPNTVANASPPAAQPVVPETAQEAVPETASPETR